MRQHLVIWSFTVVVLLGAAVLAVIRSTVLSGPPTSLRANAQAKVRTALDLLESDASAAEAATQDAIRAAAVLSQESRLGTAEAAYLLALQYQRERNLRGAETYFKRAISQRPDWSVPYSALSWLLGVHSLNRAGEAMEYARKAIALDPNDSRPHIALAVLLRFEGKLDEAEASALEALRLDPDSVASHNNYANLLVRQEEYEKAEKHYLAAIAINPRSIKPYYNLACLYTLTGQKEKALDYLAKTVEIDPIYRTQALTDPDLDAIRESPEFKEIVYKTQIEPE